MTVRRLAVIVGAMALVACKRDSAEHDVTPAPSPAAAESAKPAQGPYTGAPLVLAQGVRFAKPDDGDVAAAVRAERERAIADGRALIVYVGATWCEPCQHFHAAAKRGALDQDFPELTILEFDLDQDRERLIAAGYSSKLIPLFVAPGPDGRASEERFEGGVKGDGAVRNIFPRLQRLVEHVRRR